MTTNKAFREIMPLAPGRLLPAQVHMSRMRQVRQEVQYKGVHCSRHVALVGDGRLFW